MITNQTTDRMLRSFNDTLAILFAHQVGFFKLLSEKKSISEAELAISLNLPARSVSALTSLFASQTPPLVEKTSDGNVQFAPEGDAYLNPKSSHFMGGFIDFIIKNKEAFSPDAFATQMQVDEPHRSMFDEDKAFNQQMIAAMNAKSIGPASVWAECIDLSKHQHFLDIGGGSGIFSTNVVKKWSHLQATVFELPFITEITLQYIADMPISVIGGSFREDKYPQADIHFYSDIFHDYNDADCAILAQKSFNALPQGGRIILHELPFNQDKTAPYTTALYNLSVIRWTHGRQYSSDEFFQFLGNAGFEQLEIIPTNYLDWALITGVKA
ncbi:methyltransferase [Candidatus Albibeggiatoa sp. nov. BB20]|uniref:methyltransferase n=1 Tax=Candidatus Albibeggiatoa sp. nov. BB20 TaxID=3162723 RepID=UPI0033659AA6